MKITGQIFAFVSLTVSVIAQRCRDELRRKDCRRIKRGDWYYDSKCHLYSEECKKTCGCNYDPSDDRESHGLDDAYYESDDFQCVNETKFRDSMKFNCTLYEGAKWCMVDDSGDVVEGPGWCSWAHTLGNSHPCTIAKSRRWDKHETFNRRGRWAKSCCCNTGIAETYPYEGGGECVDYEQSGGKPWHDQYGYSCRAYHFGSFCTLDGEQGSGWKPSDGPLSDYKWDGKTVLEACCTCGGGMTV